MQDNNSVQLKQSANEYVMWNYLIFSSIFPICAHKHLQVYIFKYLESFKMIKK
jgi:hypothetical protein